MADTNSSTLQNFIQSFRSDAARPNRFEVNIFSPLTAINQNVGRNLKFRCEAAELPGRSFGTVDQKFGSNPTQKYPIHTAYNDITLTFIVSNGLQERKFFDSWMDSVNPINTFDFKYKEEYVGQIGITQFDAQNSAVYKVYLLNAYPIAVNQLDLDWSSDGYHKLAVVFAYDYWTTDPDVISLPGSGDRGQDSTNQGENSIRNIPAPVTSSPAMVVDPMFVAP